MTKLLMKEKVFINLTNGIEAIDEYSFRLDDVSFVRIQSTHCEGQYWDIILQEIDNNLFFHLALGYQCKVYDFGANTELSKAIYIGLEWCKYVLNIRWFGKEITPFLKEKNVLSLFRDAYRKLSKRTKKRIDYFKKYLLTDQLFLEGISKSTDSDNDHDYYLNIVKKNII